MKRKEIVVRATACAIAEYQRWTSTPDRLMASEALFGLHRDTNGNTPDVSMSGRVLWWLARGTFHRENGPALLSVNGEFTWLWKGVAPGPDLEIALNEAWAWHGMQETRARKLLARTYDPRMTPLGPALDPYAWLTAVLAGNPSRQFSREFRVWLTLAAT